MKVALVYDRVNKLGGAERILEVLHELYPDAPLYTAVYNKKTAGWADSFDILTTPLQKIPFAKTNHEYVAPLAPLAFESLDLSEFDIVISITSEYAKGIITKPNTLHICYCLTPTRYIWSGYDNYFTDDTAKILSKPLVDYLRMWDQVAAQRPDYYIAISKTVKERIEKYYGRKAIVIYPPVTLAYSNQRLAASSKNAKTIRYTLDASGYFLIVSRLVPYKRIDLAVTAFNKLGLNLKIIGTGREFAELKIMAGPNIEILQNLTDGQLTGYYQDCIGLIFPGEEDFGLAILEAQYFGKPVIAYRSGGALETIKEGITGEFFYPQTAEALEKAVRAFDHTKYSAASCQKQASKFHKEKFKREFSQMIRRLFIQYQKNI